MQVQLLGQSISVGRPSGYVDPTKAQIAAAAAAAALEAFKVHYDLLVATQLCRPLACDVCMAIRSSDVLSVCLCVWGEGLCARSSAGAHVCGCGCVRTRARTCARMCGYVCSFSVFICPGLLCARIPEGKLKG